MNNSTFNIIQPDNTKIIEFLRIQRIEYSYLFPKSKSPLFATWDSVSNALYDCACHPDVVEYLWTTIGRALPGDCRGLVYGSPVLAHPATGIIFGACVGTFSFLRLPRELYSVEIEAGAKTYVEVKPHGHISVSEDLGEGWILSPSTTRKPGWYTRIYEAFGKK
jgi:hypothetical protein